MSRTVPQLQATVPQGLSDDVLDMVLEGAGQALAEVDFRDDEPFLDGARHEGADLGAFRAALGELSDAYPCAPLELESVVDRLREVGVRSALRMLEAQPHLVQIVRLSLEMFVRRHPTPLDLERALREESEDLVDLSLPVNEVWSAHRRLLVALRATLS